MRILVTGGAGFIGSHVADAYVAAGHQVAVVDDLSTGRLERLPPGAGFYQMDVRDRALGEILARERPQVLSHHAAQMNVRRSVEDPIFDADVNILGSLNLLEQARGWGVRRVIFASTGGAVYGDQAPVPSPEDAPPFPLSPYGVAKLAVERYLHCYREVYGLEAVILRYANVYGPRQDPHGEAGVVAIFCQQILEGKELVVNGDGDQTRDYVYVGDVVQANLAALGVPTSGPLVVNIGTGRETSVNALLECLLQAASRTARHRHGPPRAGEQRRSAVDCRRAREILGWGALVPLSDGLRITFDWFRAEREKSEGRES